MQSDLQPGASGDSDTGEGGQSLRHLLLAPEELNEFLRGAAKLFGPSVGGPGGALAGNVAAGLSQGFTGRLAAKAAIAGAPVARNIAPSAVGGAVAAQVGRRMAIQ